LGRRIKISIAVFFHSIVQISFFVNNDLMAAKTRKKKNTGKLRIGDNWNAITIIALSQNNPLKAIAEFVENSIDARAENITIIRGKERRELYLKVIDDGEGIPLNDDGLPNFKYVATHICDSIKKRLKHEGAEGIQGEFGIGLLSFWTVGEQLILSSASKDGRTFQMKMKKGESGYSINQKRILFAHPGTELLIYPLLPGIRQLNGERIQHYLASELRDRIRKSGVKITIMDRHSRKKFDVKPREFSGRPLHELDFLNTDKGEIYLELYLNSEAPENSVGLFRSGTRVLPYIEKLDYFNREPWTSHYLQGMIDVPFLQLTPGTRDGIIHDHSYSLFCQAIKPLEEKLISIIENEKQAEEEKASRNILKSVQRALKEAFLALPREEYDWFDILSEAKKRGVRKPGNSLFSTDQQSAEEGAATEAMKQQTAEASQEESREFYKYPGSLYKAVISPASSIVHIKDSTTLRCIPRDKNRRTVEDNVEIHWIVKEGAGSLSVTEGEIVTFTAPGEPGLTILQANVSQGIINCTAESIITITASLIDRSEQNSRELNKGLPGYTFIRATGELWRSRFNAKNNLIIINNGHGDYIFASQKRARKLRYICRLFVKELILKNFPGFSREELLERMIELSLYTEENLR